jgi:hypothetical protein
MAISECKFRLTARLQQFKLTNIEYNNLKENISTAIYTATMQTRRCLRGKNSFEMEIDV